MGGNDFRECCVVNLDRSKGSVVHCQLIGFFFLYCSVVKSGRRRSQGCGSFSGVQALISAGRPGAFMHDSS